MMSNDHTLLPRTWMTTLSAFERQAEYALAGLEDNASDAEQALVLATAALIQWVAEENDGAPAGRAGAEVAVKIDDLSAWVRSPDEECICRVVECSGHRVGLCAVAQEEDARRPVGYRVPASWLSKLKLDAICCVYVQWSQSGGASILLDGWVEAERLAVPASSQPAGWVPVASDGREDLAPMHILWEAFQRERVVSGGGKLYAVLTIGMAVAAAAIVVVPAVVAPELHPATKSVNFLFNAEPMRGGGRQVVYGGQEFQIEIRAETTRKHGWLFQVDPAAVWRLGALKPQTERRMILAYRDVFDDRPGFEYFVVVLADEPWPVEHTRPNQPEPWLAEPDLAHLQALAREGDEAQAVQRIRAALDRVDVFARDYDVRLMIVEHRSR